LLSTEHALPEIVIATNSSPVFGDPVPKPTVSLDNSADVNATVVIGSFTVHPDGLSVQPVNAIPLGASALFGPVIDPVASAFVHMISVGIVPIFDTSLAEPKDTERNTDSLLPLASAVPLITQ
jgi:hypothetical protein